MSWAITEEAISVIESTAERLGEITEAIHSETAKLRDAFEENQNGLGAHTDSIQSLLEEMESEEESGAKLVKKLVRKLTRAVQIRREILENDRYKGHSR